jgi:hypothetical protein
VLISRQWFWWPALTIGMGLGFLVCSGVIRILHPGQLAEVPISFASGSPVTLKIERRFKMMVEVRLRVDERPNEPNWTSMKRPSMRVEASGAELIRRDYDKPWGFQTDSIQFEYAWVKLRAKTPATITVHPSGASSAIDQRNPRLVIHEFHPDWGGFFAISIFANWSGAACILIGMGTLASRASKLKRRL